MRYFRDQPDSGVTSASQVAVVGDRLFTDVMMANMMGSYGVWVKDGIIERKSLVRIPSIPISDMELADLGARSSRGWKMDCPRSCSGEGIVRRIP